MKLMYIRHKLGEMAPFLSGESEVYACEHLKAVSLYCTTFSRGIWMRPLCLSLRGQVTNRRILLSCQLLPFYRQEVDLWFPGQGPEGGGDVITEVSRVETSRGPCLEILSRDETRRKKGFSAPALTTRIWCLELDAMEQAVRGIMENRSDGSRHD